LSIIVFNIATLPQQI